MDCVSEVGFQVSSSEFGTYFLKGKKNRSEMKRWFGFLASLHFNHKGAEIFFTEKVECTFVALAI